MKYQKGEYSFVPYNWLRRLKSVLYAVPRENLPGARAGNELVDDVTLPDGKLEKIVKKNKKR